MSSDLVKLSANEDEFLAELLKERKTELAFAVPEDMTFKDVMSGIRLCASYLGKLERVGNMIGAVLGRYMALAAKSPEMYKKMGYPTLEALEQAEILDKIGRTTLWDYKKISEAFPTMPLEEFRNIRKGNLLDAAKVIEGKSETQVTEIVAKAKELPNKAFREWLEEESHAGRGELDGGSLLLTGTKAELDELKGLLADRRCQKYFGERHIDQVLGALKESTTQWPEEEQPDIPPHGPIAQDGGPGGW